MLAFRLQIGLQNFNEFFNTKCNGKLSFDNEFIFINLPIKLERITQKEDIKKGDIVYISTRNKPIQDNTTHEKLLLENGVNLLSIGKNSKNEPLFLRLGFKDNRSYTMPEIYDLCIENIAKKSPPESMKSIKFSVRSITRLNKSTSTLFSATSESNFEHSESKDLVNHNKLKKLNKNIENHPSRAKEKLARAKFYLENGNYIQAYADFNSVFTVYPENKEAKEGMAKCKKAGV